MEGGRDRRRGELSERTLLQVRGTHQSNPVSRAQLKGDSYIWRVLWFAILRQLYKHAQINLPRWLLSVFKTVIPANTPKGIKAGIQCFCRVISNTVRNLILSFQRIPEGHKSWNPGIEQSRPFFPMDHIKPFYLVHILKAGILPRKRGF